ncbi:MAG: respiratory nitrate reductase subunit gamma [Desulfobacterales bacterium]|nr:respiratory nitrate reductase subunit gamma [Desulfobacterales bacterium]
MHGLYNFVRGPLAWVAFILFIGGSLYRLISMYKLARKKDVFVFEYTTLYFALRSILHWIIPFGNINSRNRPIFTIVTFAFHICLLAVPIFLLAHIILWDESFNINWWSLPDGVADIMALIVVAGCGYFLWRRLTQPEAKFVTSAGDYVILAIVAAPFITGFLAYHQWLGYKFWLILHILSGEIWLAAIPFTRLSHMLFFPLNRAYIGSEFGAVRHVRDY